MFCPFHRYYGIVDVTGVVIVLYRVVGGYLRELHCLGFGHQIGFGLRLWLGNDCVLRDFIDSVIQAFDDDIIRLVVHIRDGEWTVDD